MAAEHGLPPDAAPRQISDAVRDKEAKHRAAVRAKHGSLGRRRWGSYARTDASAVRKASFAKGPIFQLCPCNVSIWMPWGSSRARRRPT
jgi:hypothetical protein